MRRLLSYITISALLLMIIPSMVFPAYAADKAEYSAKLTFSDDGIAETSAGSGYTIDGTALSITAAGTYDITGSCSEGSIEVAKSLSDVTLILDGLTLTSSSTAPLVIKKSSTVNIHLADNTASTLTDNEDPANESSSDATVADAYEGAAIKVKSGSTATFCGGGSLSIVANSKNGIKGGSTAALIFNQSGTVSISGSYSGYATSAGAVKNGIASDGSVTVNQGTFDIDAAGDGIKSTPDATDKTEGTVIDTESAGTVTINGGIFDIDVDGDGIQADTALTITNGTFDITTMSGYDISGTKVYNFDKYNGSESYLNTAGDYDNSTMSCKGLKASGDRAEEAGTTPALNISGGGFTFNTADDAVHSDGNVTVSGGTFAGSAGDDFMHADMTLTVGADGGYSRDPDVTIKNCYEGLEGANVYMYSGRYYILARDDGMNSAGGSTDTDSSVPGRTTSTESTSTNIYIYGGDTYINTTGDGIDSNGSLYMYGGTHTVLSAGGSAKIEEQPLDWEKQSGGEFILKGATVFAAGINFFTSYVPDSGSQTYTNFNNGQSLKYSAGTILTVTSGSTLVFNETLPRAITYAIYSNPSYSSKVNFGTASSVTACSSDDWAHSWDDGTVTTAATSETTGLMTYTCSSCGKKEYQTIPKGVSVGDCDHSVATSEEDDEDEGFTVAFAGDSGVSSINVYYTQDYTSVNETVTATGTTVSRNGDTGEPDSTGSGQVNFQAVLSDGYSLSGVSVTSGTYKNIKGPSDTGQSNTYRITKITANTTITITTAACSHGTVAEGTTPEWTWADGYGSATLTYTCADCGSSVSVNGTLASVLTDSSTITFTATAAIGGTEYTSTQTAAPFTASFSTDEGVASVDVYYTQDYTTADETDITTAVARDSDNGYPVVSGEGQMNFRINLKDGYTLSNVAATSGTYKNIKGPSDTGQSNTYRITKITANTTITITTKKEETATFTVTFESNGGSEVTSQTVESGSTATEPTAPTRTGYTFGGWYSDEDLTTAYDFDTAVTADITLYAKWTENQEAMTVSASGYSGTYDGEAHSITVSVTVPESGATVKYGTTEGTYDQTSAPTYTDAGTYKVYYQVTSTGYTTETGSATVTIAKADSSVTAAPTANTLTYTGSAQALVTAGTASGGEMQYSLDNDTYSTSIPTGTDAGTYTVYYKVTGDDNHNDTDAASVIVTIAKADPTVTAPAANTLTYNGEPQALVTAGSTSGGTMSYSSDGETYSSDIPTGTNAGSYTVYYKVTGENYTAVTDSVAVTISKASLSNVSVAQTGTLTYNGSEQTATVTTAATAVNDQDVTFTYSTAKGGTYSEAVPAFTNAGSHTVYYKASADNHNSTQGTFTVTIGKADSSAVITGLTDLTYTGEAQALVTEEKVVGGTVLYSLKGADADDFAEGVPAAVNAGSYTVWWKIEDSSNYNGSNGSVTAAISTKEMTITAEGYNAAYNGAAHGITVTVDEPEGATVKYGTAERTYSETSSPAYTDVGEYTVYYQVTAANYKEETGSAKVVITQAANTVTVSIDGWTYGETANSPASTADFGADTVTYTYSDASDGEYTSTVPTTAGTWYVKASIAETANYAAAENAVSFDIAKAEITIAADDKSSKYGDKIQELSYKVSGNYVDGDELGVELSTQASSGSAVGEYAISVSWNGNSNYNATLANGKYTITKAESSVETAPEEAGLTYTGSAQDLVTDGAASGGTMYYALSPDGTAVPEASDYSVSIPTGTDAGDYTVYYYVKGDANHNDSEVETLSVSISTKALTITANDNTIYYGSAPADDGVVTEGFEGTDSLDDLDGSLTYTYTYEKNGKPGTYNIAAGGLSSGNYSIVYKPGTLTVKDKVSVIAVKAKASGKKALKLSWNAVTDAASYEVYFGKCGKSAKKIATVTKTSYTKKKLAKSTCYRYYVIAKDKDGKKLAASISGHAVTGNVKGKYTNAKSLKVSNTSVTLSKGGTAKIGAAQTKVKKGKKLLSGGHAAILRYRSDNKAVATVDAKGKITAVGTGWCRVYVQTVNGIWKTIEVTVK